jgi:NAD(P)-dependent dehydrogenase (short-subunit alcohol dehydrogenase family)
MLLQDKVCIVTGGGSGIGEETAKLFAEEGAKVVVADLNEREGERVAQEIEALRGVGAAFAVRADVSSEADVQALVAAARSVYGRIDVLFNNAATILPKPLEEVTEREWSRLVDVNLKSVYLMVKHTIAELRKTRGTIVSMASLNGLVGQRQNAAYAATKGGIIAMTKALALDYASNGVRVNCICPAGVMTPLLEKWILEQDEPEEARRALNDMHPLGRPAYPREIAKVALFLASEQSGFVTGVALPVEGGASLGY